MLNDRDIVRILFDNIDRNMVTNYVATEKEHFKKYILALIILLIAISITRSGKVFLVKEKAFVADHPFVYVIKLGNVILFAGKVK